MKYPPSVFKKLYSERERDEAKGEIERGNVLNTDIHVHETRT